MFAELDSSRRQALVSLISDAEQVLITAAVDQDIPDELRQKAQIFSICARDTEDGRISEVVQKPGGAAE